MWSTFDTIFFLNFKSKGINSEETFIFQHDHPENTQMVRFHFCHFTLLCSYCLLLYTFIISDRYYYFFLCSSRNHHLCVCLCGRYSFTIIFTTVNSAGKLHKFFRTKVVPLEMTVIIPTIARTVLKRQEKMMKKALIRSIFSRLWRCNNHR